MIYGITGKKGHGKDTLAQAIICANNTYTTLHFASPLKYMCKQIFDLTNEQVHDPAAKELTLSNPVVMDDYIWEMEAFVGLEISRKNKVAYTPRELMQYFGTDYVRSAQNDYWVRNTINEAHKKQNVVIPDTRFINEFEAVKSAGGKIIRVVRIDGPISSVGTTHASETEMDKFVPDYTCEIKDGDLEQFNHIANALVGK